MRNFILVCLLAGLYACNETSAPAVQKVADERVAQFDSLYSQLYREGAFHGNVLVAEKGTIIFEKAYGLANAETKEKLKPDTRYELASISKPFTAAGILLLQKDGSLSFEDHLSTYFPELAIYPDIQIKHLLHHTSGIADYMALASEYWDRSKIATNSDMIALFAEHQPELLFPTNSEWRYSNTGYLLLASIIEKVSNQSYGDFLNERIFTPLNMQNTFVYQRRYAPKELENYAQGYMYSEEFEALILPDKLGQDFYMIFLDGIVGDGMVNSNARDLLKWDRALRTDGFFTKTDRELLFQSASTSSGEDTSYGLGWFLEDKKGIGKMSFHSGGWAGYINYLERHMDKDNTIILLQNHSTQTTSIPVKNTRNILYGLPVERPTKLPKELLQKYAGTYISEKGKEKEILFKDDKLWIALNPETHLELIPVSETKCIVDGFSPEVSYTFILNEQGEVEKYHVQQIDEGIDRYATRKKE